ncbi:hypothetical protein [Limnobacter sp.]|uniref:hypothetical protein n=1 Tax=Limnobacter sp. TaxID=2003368 RepID=UPI0027323D3B|nr:hypothetical protein [Limnobacter sp.]MDP3273457.1 hypothetical protein [Limnobacter sp.]
MIAKVAKSKTMWFAYLLAVLGVVETQYKLIESYVPEEYRGLVFVVIASVVAALRIVTTQALTEK